MTGERRPPLARWLLVWLGVLGLALLLSLLVMLEMLPDEAPAVRKVQGWRFTGDSVSNVVRGITTTAVVAVIGLLLAALHWLRGERRAAVILVALVIVLPVAQASIKELVDRPRPAEAGIEQRAAATSPSFPAGHVMSPTVVYGWAIAMALRDRPSHGGSPAWLRASVLAVAGLLVGLLGVSGLVNLYLGVHWPTDVLGGYLWGLVLLLPALGLHDALSRRQ